MPSTTNFGWTTPADTDLVKDGAAAIRTLGNGVDASFVDLKGGTTGQILSKNSNTDLDFTWVAANEGDITAVTAGTGISGGGTAGAVTITNSMATEITAAGDIIVGTGSGTFDNLPIGTTGQVLTADTTVSPYKVKWAAVGGGLTYTNIATSATSPLPDVTNGNATIIHRYAQSGKFVHQFLQFTWGSTTTISSGASLLTLTAAVTAASGYSIFAAGTALFYDSSANQVFLGRLRMDSSSIYLYAEDDLGSYLRSVNTTNTVPMTWATGDVITVNAFYEAA